MSRCAHTSGESSPHTHGRTLCFTCFRAGIERTRARREAWAQRSLPFDDASQAPKPLGGRPSPIGSGCWSTGDGQSARLTMRALTKHTVSPSRCIMYQDDQEEWRKEEAFCSQH
jgi:hypothetical protein